MIASVPPALVVRTVPTQQTDSAAPRLPLIAADKPVAEMTAPLPSGLGGTAQVVTSSQLLGPHHAIEIDHNGQRYRLQSTRSGKLILTK
ncbi:MAG: hemin uptake protein HemP [Rhodoferax sp.]|nr:hemin uptake protein HemP [Rhodoferax sp.]